jgi:hypothetical protein
VDRRNGVKSAASLTPGLPLGRGDSRSDPTSDRFGRGQPTRPGEQMDQPVNPDERDPSVMTVAAVSLVAGLACTLAPVATARLAGIDRHPGRRPRGRPGGRGPGAGPVRRAVVAMAAGPRRLEPGHRRRVAYVSPVTTRPPVRCRPYGCHRLRPPHRRPAPRHPPLTGRRRSARHHPAERRLCGTHQYVTVPSWGRGSGSVSWSRVAVDADVWRREGWRCGRGRGREPASCLAA